MRRFVLLASAVLLALALHAQARLPKVMLKNTDGKSVQTDTLSNNGRPVIVSFFATWCKPCNRELNAIHEVYDDWQQETGVRLVAVSIDQAQNVNKVQPMVDEYGWTYEVLLDTNGDFKRSLGVQMIPYVLVLDGKGNIVYKHNGYADGAETELFEKVKEAAGR